MQNPVPQLLTQQQSEKLLENGSPENRDKNHTPVVKLFLPGTAFTWLLSEIDPEEPRLAFGLCDLGMGFPELGYVDLLEITSVKAPFGVECDIYFEGKYPMSVYVSAACSGRAITEDEEILSLHVPRKPPGCTP